MLGVRVSRPVRKVLDALRSSWLIRSATLTRYGTSGTVRVVTVSDGPITIAPAGHGAGQLDGYRVVAPTAKDAEFGGVVVDPGAVPIAMPRVLCSDPLSVIPNVTGTEPASFRLLRHGIVKPSSRFRSSQNRRKLGLSGCVQFTFNSRSTDSPPNSCAPRPGRARNSNE